MGSNRREPSATCSKIEFPQKMGEFFFTASHLPPQTEGFLLTDSTNHFKLNYRIPLNQNMLNPHSGQYLKM